MMQLIIVRPATEEDEIQILELLDNYMRKDFFMTSGHLHRVITGFDIYGKYHLPCKTYIAIHNEQIIAFGVVTGQADTLINLFVHPDYRKQGLGKEMIKLLRPSKIRVKRDMADGDPLDFYINLGYNMTDVDGQDSHITVLENEEVLQPSLFSHAPKETNVEEADE